ncbi:MAG: hypothetical protein Q27BB25_05975 [Blastomonas sp. CACIA14H2]|nr:MAG: hypothetical protein Q27BB25_05975 [Blastomonas sp. CACIA14H2]
MASLAVKPSPLMGEGWEGLMVPVSAMLQLKHSAATRTPTAAT